MINRIRIDGDIAYIGCLYGYGEVEVKVDVSKLDFIKQRFNELKVADIPSGKKIRRYARECMYDQNKGKNTTILLHRELVGNPKGLRVIFRDGDSLNCTMENLQLVTQRTVVRRNQPVKAKSGHKGVSKSTYNGKWYARIKVNRRDIHLGTYDTKEEAIAARKDAEIKYWRNER